MADQQKPETDVERRERVAAEERKRFVASQQAQRRALFGLPPED